MIRRPVLVLLTGAALLIGGAGLWLVDRPAPASAVPAMPGFGSHFALTTTDGRAVTEADYRGKWLIVYFGYTYCPDACPTALAEIAQAVDRLGDLGDQVQPLFVTVDPERDTPTVLAEYVKSFGAHMVALRGTAAATAAAAHAFRVSYVRRELGGGSYAMDHSSFIYVIDPQGRFAKLIAADGGEHDLAGTLRGLIR